MTIEDKIINKSEIRNFFLKKKYKRTNFIKYTMDKLSYLMYTIKENNYRKHLLSFFYITLTTGSFYLFKGNSVSDTVFLSILVAMPSVMFLLITYGEWIDEHEIDGGGNEFKFIFLNISSYLFITWSLISTTLKAEIICGVIGIILLVINFYPIFKFIVKSPFSCLSYLYNYNRSKNMDYPIEKKDHVFLTNFLNEDELILFLEKYHNYGDLPLEMMSQMESLDINGIKHLDRKEVIKEYAKSLYKE